MHLLQHFKELTVRPKNAQELKGLILQLAIQGKLTANWRNENPTVESASVLLKRIEKERKKLITEKKIKNEKPIATVDISEIPFTLPSNWCWCRLNDLGIIGSSSRVHQKDWQSEGVPFYRAREIVKLSKFGKVNNELFITEELFNKFKDNDSVPEENDIMITGVGTIGIPYIVNTKDRFYFKDASVLIFKNIFNLYPEYLKLFFSSQYWIDEIHKDSMGTTVHTLTISRAKLVPTILPPLEEQKAIVAVVETLFKEVEQLEQLTIERISLKEKFVVSALNQLTTNNTKKEWGLLQEHFYTFFNEKTNIKKLRETVLQLAVQGKLTADWRANNPDFEDASILLKRIQYEKAQLVKDKQIKDEKQISSFTEEEIPFLLPKSWVWCRMQDLCPNISSGSTPPKPYFKEEGVPYLKVYNIKNQKIDFEYRKQFVDTEYHLTKLKRSILRPGDVIMNIVGPPLGKVAIIPDDYPEWNCNQAISFFQPLDRKFNTWIYTYLLAGTFLDRIELIGTAGQDNISVTKSKTIMLPLPPYEEQKAIVEKVNALMGLCDALEKEVKQSQEQSEKLMQSVLREVFETGNS